MARIFVAAISLTVVTSFSFVLFTPMEGSSQSLVATEPVLGWRTLYLGQKGADLFSALESSGINFPESRQRFIQSNSNEFPSLLERFFLDAYEETCGPSSYSPQQPGTNCHSLKLTISPQDYKATIGQSFNLVLTDFQVSIRFAAPIPAKEFFATFEKTWGISPDTITHLQHNVLRFRTPSRSGGATCKIDDGSSNTSYCSIFANDTRLENQAGAAITEAKERFKAAAATQAQDALRIR